jgi:hypothetical protein
MKLKWDEKNGIVDVYVERDEECSVPFLSKLVARPNGIGGIASVWAEAHEGLDLEDFIDAVNAFLGEHATGYRIIHYHKGKVEDLPERIKDRILMKKRDSEQIKVSKEIEEFVKESKKKFKHVYKKLKEYRILPDDYPKAKGTYKIKKSL